MIPLLAALALQARPAPVPAKPPVVNWRPSPKTPEALAARMDAALARVRATRAESIAAYLGKDGRGQDRSKIAFDTPSRYRIEFPRCTARLRDIEQRALVADGRGRAAKAQGMKWYPTAPSRADLLPARLLPDFAFNGPSVIAASMGRDARAFSRLVREARASGWRATVATARYGGQTLERVTLSRPGRVVQIVTEPKTGLPLTLRGETPDPLGGTIRTVYSVRWIPGQKFAANDKRFVVPVTEKRRNG